MSDPKHKDERFSVLNPRNHAIVADPVSPKFAGAFALQRLTDRTRIIERSDPIAQGQRKIVGGAVGRGPSQSG
jgi:hypothetical protein